MTSSSKAEGIENLVTDIFNFAIAREDLKEQLKIISENSNANLVAVEYEIQLLKILSAGWSISFFMGQDPDKTLIAKTFWNSIQEFAKNISDMTSTTTGKDIDYFNILKERVDIYVNALSYFSDVQDPSAVIGPTFAKLCGCEEDIYTINAGKNIFNHCLKNVKAFLENDRLERKFI
ncbi:Uncharacterized protein dnl_19810 [Desulfonema limicola]|uniref:Uncharacterized protein n=1 Tax=Desulfonema limicola TaxID=45656 RepID=A0A975B6H1_9BACT|nr:hypothetical protein [Desulfonema limicola]QTA79705.1 Uncharacterized protein dnl_19810 [Desulfonema limicola]